MDRDLPVEWVSAPAEDEDLPQHREREFPTLRRLRVPLGYLLVAAFVVLGVVKVVSSGGSGTASAASSSGSGSPSASVGSTPPGSTDSGIPETVVTHGGSGGLITDDTIACPSGESCRTSDDVPRAVLTALRAAYPGAAVAAARTVTADGAAAQTLLTRTLQVTAAGLEITVQVLPYLVGADHTSTQHEAPDTLVYASSGGTGMTIQVTVVQRDTATSPVARALALARDVRLLVVA